MSNIDVPLEARIKYIERRKTDLQSCEQALQSKDFETLARVAHQIKGNAVSFGFDELGNIAIDLETYALEHDASKLDQVIFRFSQFLKENNADQLH